MSEDLKHTPLFDIHTRLGGKMVPFAGYEMPVQFSGVIDEHRTVRENVGLFDVSHMGEVELLGPKALEVANRIITNDLAAAENGQAVYAVMCNEQGGIIDDLVVYRFSPERIFICVNASNRAKDVAWIKERAGRDCEVVDKSDDYAQLAVQGPRAQELVATLTDADLPSIGFYRFSEGKVAGADAIISRTGYTGEDGFELYVGANDANRVLEALFDNGERFGAKPCGLGARDSLRLEMKYCLYGNDIDDSTNPIEAGLGWVVKLKKESFFAKDELVRIKAAPLTRKLVGFEVTGRGIARPDYVLTKDGAPIGKVTSGTMGPSVQKAIGLGYVGIEHSKVGSAIQVEVRGRPVDAQVVKTPFYTRPEKS